MTMKHGLLPEDRPQDHGAVREASTVASLLDVLGDATRLAILRHLHGGEHRVVELTEHLGLAQSTVSQHLAILRSAGLISSHSHGRANVSRIENPEAIEQVLADAKAQGIHGKETTPFLLARVKDLTGGDSLDSNIQLVYNNARLAARTACALQTLEQA